MNILKLCVATNLTDINQGIESKTIKQWHQNKMPDLSKKTMYLPSKLSL